jgi:hypothetical protein
MPEVAIVLANRLIGPQPLSVESRSLVSLCFAPKNPRGGGGVTVTSAEISKDKDRMSSIGQVDESVKPFGPIEEHRQGFGRTFLGTLLGQTVAMLGTLAAYVNFIVVIWRYFSEDLRGLHELFGFWSWIILTAPLVCIFLFSMLPTALRAWRERQLKNAAIGGDPKFRRIPSLSLRTV